MSGGPVVPNPIPYQSPSPTPPTATPGSILPNGRPNFNAAASGGSPVDTSGMLNIWNIPKEITSQEIWFDVGHKSLHVSTDVGAAHSPDISPGLNIEKTTKTGAYQILKSPSEIMKQFAAMSFNDPNQFLALQRALATGAWGSVNATGAFDSATEKALGSAMLQYVKLTQGAGVGVSFTDYLLQTGERAQQLNPPTGGAASVVRLDDPTAIRAAAQQAAQQALGQGLSEDQLSKFVAQFQAAQTTYQTATSGSAASPDLSGQAAAYAQQADPQAFHDNQRQSYLSALVNMFAPSGSQRPNTTPVPKV